MGLSRSSSLRIGDDSSTVAGSGRVRDAPDRSAVVEPRNAHITLICRSTCCDCGT